MDVRARRPSPESSPGGRTRSVTSLLERPLDRFGHVVNGAVLELLRESTVDVADARYLPGWVYSSEEWFEFENEAIFNRSWLCVGRAGFLQKPGDYYTV